MDMEKNATNDMDRQKNERLNNRLSETQEIIKSNNYSIR
jgi:hypothetical protein